MQKKCKIEKEMKIKSKQQEKQFLQLVAYAETDGEWNVDEDEDGLGQVEHLLRHESHSHST